MLLGHALLCACGRVLGECEAPVCLTPDTARARPATAFAQGVVKLKSMWANSEETLPQESLGPELARRLAELGELDVITRRAPAMHADSKPGSAAAL